MILLADTSDTEKWKETKVFIASWVLARIRDAYRPALDPRMFEAMGFLNKDQQMCGGVVYHDFVGHDVQVTAAGEGLWLTPLNVRSIFEYPFHVLKVERMTAHIAKPNKRSRRFVERLGFKLEGTIRKGFPGGKDKMAYGLLKSECRWIK